MARICEELKNLMEAFDVSEGREEPLASTDVKTRLRHALIDAASEIDDESADVKSVEAILQSTIERVTGMPWYEATKSKIVWDLLEYHSISHTIDDILDKLITAADESEKIEEKLNGSLTQKEATDLALSAIKEDPSAYAVLYGVRYPNERRAHFFEPVYIEDENEMRHRVGSATMVYAIYNKKDPFKKNKEDANSLMMKIEKLYNRYHDYVDGEYTAHNEVESDKIIDELHDLLIENGLREEEIGCIIDAMDIDYRKDFIPVVLQCLHSMKEDVVKQGSYWVNKGKAGTHGKFKTKKEAEAQMRAIYSRGFKEAYGSEKHPEQDAIETALKNIRGTEKVEFDYRPNDGVYADPEDHLIVLVFTDNMFAPSEAEDDPDDENWYKNRAKWKRLVIRRLDKMGWELEDPAEDNDTYLYLVLRKKKNKEATNTVATLEK